MQNPKYSSSDLVIYDRAIYEVRQVEIKDDETYYQLNFVAYIQDTGNNLNYEVKKTPIVKESELTKFNYSPPRYKMGQKDIRMVIFKEKYKEYRYNVGNTAGLSWEDLVHRH